MTAVGEALERARWTRCRERTRGQRAVLRREAERLARLCHAMAERFARGGRLIAFGALAGGALGRAPRRGRVRPPGDRRQAGAAGDRAGRRGRRLAAPGRAARRARRHRDRVRRRRRRWRGRAALAAARERGCLTIAFAPAGRGVGVRAAERRPVRRARSWSRRSTTCSGSSCTCSSSTADCSRGATRAASTTPARRASCTRSSPSARATSRRSLDDVRALGADEGRGDRRAARADADRESRRRCSPRRPRCARASTQGGKLLALGNGGSATDAMDVVADFRAAPQGWPRAAARST